MQRLPQSAPAADGKTVAGATFDDKRSEGQYIAWLFSSITEAAASTGNSDTTANWITRETEKWRRDVQLLLLSQLEHYSEQRAYAWAEFAIDLADYQDLSPDDRFKEKCRICFRELYENDADGFEAAVNRYLSSRVQQARVTTEAGLHPKDEPVVFWSPRLASDFAKKISQSLFPESPAQRGRASTGNSAQKKVTDSNALPQRSKRGVAEDPITFQVAIPTAQQWSAVANTVDRTNPKGLWVNDKIRFGSLNALRNGRQFTDFSGTTAEPLISNLSGNLHEIVKVTEKESADKRYFIMGSSYREELSAWPVDRGVPIQSDVSSPTVGVRLVITEKSEKDIRSPDDIQKNLSLEQSITKKQKDVCDELFGTREIPDTFQTDLIKTQSEAYYKRIIRGIKGDHNFWVAEAVRDILWGDDNARSKESETPHTRMWDEAYRVLYGQIDN